MPPPQKQKADRKNETAPKTRRPGPVNQGPEALTERSDWLALQCVLDDLAICSPVGIGALQKTAGNRAVQRFVVQRQAPEEEDELQLKTIQRQPSVEEETLAMKLLRRVGPEGGPVPWDVESAINRGRGGGQPLEGGVQAQMGERTGYDFNGMRVHSDTEAVALNQQLSAPAADASRDVLFQRGKYAPGFSSDRELGAHESSRVVQQGIGRAVAKDADPGLQADGGDSGERILGMSADASHTSRTAGQSTGRGAESEVVTWRESALSGGSGALQRQDGQITPAQVQAIAVRHAEDGVSIDLNLGRILEGVGFCVA